MSTPSGRARAIGLVRVLRLVLVVSLALAGSAVMAGVAAADSAVPYTDPNAVGYIGLCDQSGHQITSGNINTTPFAWRAISSTPALAPYNNSWRTAILLAYQPQQGLSPSEWSGDELTASSRYTDPADPMVAATDGDDSLEDFIEEFHPKWDGFLQLRIYLGTEDAEVYSVHYPTLNIHVSGDNWTAVDGGSVNCNSGTSTSLESIVLPASTIDGSSGAGAAIASGSKSHGSKNASGAAATDSPAASTGRTSAAGATLTGSRALASAAVSDSSHSSSATLISIVVAALLALATSAFFIRRRRTASLSPDSGPTKAPMKGHRS